VLATQINKILQKTRKEKNNFQFIRILKRNEKFEFSSVKDKQIKSSEIVIFSKKKKRKRKTKKSILLEHIDLEIYMIEAAFFHLLIKQKKAKIFALFFREIDIQINATSSRNIDIQLSKIEKILIDFNIIILHEYHDFLNVFFK
jgi:hypothetical protein